MFQWNAIFHHAADKTPGYCSITNKKIRFSAFSSDLPQVEWDEFSVTVYRKDQKIFIESVLDPAQRLELPDQKDLILALKNQLNLNIQQYFLHWLRGRELAVVSLFMISFVAFSFIALRAVRMWAPVFVPWVDIETEMAFGEDVFNKHLKTDVIKLDDDLQAEWDKLIANLTSLEDVQGYQYKIYIWNHDEPNAYALPGGILVFTKAFLLQAETPEEILGVLGHELAHAHKRHTVKAVVADYATRATKTLLLSGMTGAIVSNAEEIFSLDYSRAQEAEADHSALTYLRKRQISNQGLLAFFQRLLNTKEMGLLNIKWLSSHPLTEERLQAISSFPSYEAKKVDFPLDRLKIYLQEYRPQ